MHKTAVKTQLDLVALQVHILVLHLSRTVEMGGIGGCHIHQRVVGLIGHGGVDAVFLLTVDGVEAQRVVYRLIVVIDSELQRVHVRGVGSGIICLQSFDTGGVRLCGISLLAGKPLVGRRHSATGHGHSHDTHCR